MFVTQEVLDKYNACDFGKKLIARLYPDGAEISTILENRHIPIEIFHWGYDYLPVTEGEIEQYWAACKVKDSEHVNHSKNILRSICVNQSEDISYSRNIDNCKKVTSSTLISTSEEVENSREVQMSKRIKDSTYVYGASDVSFGKQIVLSNMISDSQGVVHSSNIHNSNNVVGSEEISNSAFISNSKFLNNCFFCCGAEYGNGLVFNKPASPFTLNHIREVLSGEFSTQIMYPLSFEGDLYIEKHHFTENFGTYYQDFSKGFWDWVKTLPNYDPFVMYNLTYLPMWLQD